MDADENPHGCVIAGALDTEQLSHVCYAAARVFCSEHAFFLSLNESLNLKDDYD